MEKIVLYEKEGLYRDDFRVVGYQFGQGEKSVCIVGNTRGNENQQVFCCSQLVKKLKELEQAGCLMPEKQIMVIPCANPYSLNMKKRFWGIDNTDINRMFPGYDQGETTQRIAAGLFEAVKGYSFGIQFASFYMKGSFVPHVRMMQTGYENIELASQFGLPYVIVRRPRPFDTTTLNYNWQIWETNAFSIYTTQTEVIDHTSADMAVEAILRFLSKQDIITYQYLEAQPSHVIDDSNLLTIRARSAGFFDNHAAVGSHVRQGDLLARIIDPCEGYVRSEVYAPAEGTIIFAHGEPMTYDCTAIYKMVCR